MRKLAVILLLLSGSVLAEETTFIAHNDCQQLKTHMLSNRNYVADYTLTFVGAVNTVRLNCYNNTITTWSRDEWLALKQQEQIKREQEAENRRNHINMLKQKHNIQG